MNNLFETLSFECQKTVNLLNMRMLIGIGKRFGAGGKDGAEFCRTKMWTDGLLLKSTTACTELHGIQQQFWIEVPWPSPSCNRQLCCMSTL